MVTAKREAEGVVQEAKRREQEMQALQLEVEELDKGLQSQQQQVCLSVCLSVSVRISRHLD